MQTVPLHPHWCFQHAIPRGVGNATAVFTLEILVVCLILYQWDLLLHKIDCSVEQRHKYKGTLSHWRYLDVFSHTFVRKDVYLTGGRLILLCQSVEGRRFSEKRSDGLE